MTLAHRCGNPGWCETRGETSHADEHLSPKGSKVDDLRDDGGTQPWYFESRNPMKHFQEPPSLVSSKESLMTSKFFFSGIFQLGTLLSQTCKKITATLYPSIFDCELSNNIKRMPSIERCQERFFSLYDSIASWSQLGPGVIFGIIQRIQMMDGCYQFVALTGCFQK